MPILGFVMMVALGAAVWWWRLKMLHEAGSEVIDTVERMRGAFRRKQFRKKAEAAPLSSIRDPAIAAVTFFLSLAHEKPALLEQARTVIRTRMAAIIKPSDMEDILVFAEWTAKNVVNLDDPIRRFRDIWMNALDMDERRDLISMAEEVCALGGDPTPEQAKTLQTLRRTLLN